MFRLFNGKAQKSGFIFDHIFDLSGDGYLVVDLKTDCILQANTEVCRQFGLSKGQMQSICLKNLFSEQDRGSLIELQVFAIRHNSASTRALTCFNQKENRRILLRVSATKIKDSSGYLLLLCLVDDSERVRNERFLSQARERTQLTLDAIGSGIITTDSHGRVEYLNPVAEQLTAISMQEAIGQRLEDIMFLSDEPGGSIVKSLVPVCLLNRKVFSAEKTIILRSNRGNEYAIKQTASPIITEEGNLLGAVLVFKDVTESHEIARKIAYRATHDSLTGLVNRDEFEDRLDIALTSAQKRGQEHALCYLDLDRFKIVNDTAGHLAGDELLRQLAALLANKLRGRDTLARLGGDEFALLLEHCPIERAIQIAEELIVIIREFRFTWDTHSFQIGCSIGLVPMTKDDVDVGELIGRADVACYIAKDMGRNCVHLYHSDDQVKVERETQKKRVSDLNRALQSNYFELYCQPIYKLLDDSQILDSYEILLRLNVDNTGELLPPGSFIPAAERYGIMAKIDRWVIDKSLDHFSRMQGKEGSAVHLSINLSATSLSDLKLPQYIQRLLKKYHVSADSICFEISETSAVRDMGSVIKLIKSLKMLGCRTSLDNFGTGFSSFGHLKRLQVDYIKIDGSLVQSMSSSSVDRSVVASINAVAHALGVKTIAEYVGSDQTIKILSEMGVDYGQGYCLGLPKPIAVMS